MPTKPPQSADMFADLLPPEPVQVSEPVVDESEGTPETSQAMPAKSTRAKAVEPALPLLGADLAAALPATVR